MKIDKSKLTEVVTKKDGNIEAQCPACAAAGHDKTGNHLIVYPDGRFGCVANQGDKAHNKEILHLVGIEDHEEEEAQEIPKLTVRPFRVPPSTAIMKVPRRTLEDLGLKRSDNPEK